MTCAKDPEHAETEARIQKAIAKYKKQQKEDPQDRKPSVQCIIKDFNIPDKTLEGHLKGVVPCNQAQEVLMNLTIHEEKELVHWITTFTQHDYAPQYCTVCELAEIIRNRRVRGVN